MYFVCTSCYRQCRSREIALNGAWFEWRRRSTINPDSQLHVLELAFREAGDQSANCRWPVCTQYVLKQSVSDQKQTWLRELLYEARKQQSAWFFETLWSQEWRDCRPKVLKFTTGHGFGCQAKPIFCFYTFCSLKFDIISTYFSHRQRSLATRSEGLYIPCWAYGWRSVLTSVTSVNVEKACLVEENIWKYVSQIAPASFWNSFKYPLTIVF